MSVEEANATETIKAIRHLDQNALQNPHFQDYLNQHTLAELSNAFHRVLEECFKVNVSSEAEQF